MHYTDILSSSTEIVVRPSYPDDADALRRLAALDSARDLVGPALVAEAGGELRAAVSLIDGRVIADPFHPTADAVALLQLRASRMRSAVVRGRRFRRHGRAVTA